MLQVEVCFLCFRLVSRPVLYTLDIYQLEKLSRIDNLGSLFWINWMDSKRCGGVKMEGVTQHYLQEKTVRFGEILS
jgi:hypothetical protein